MSASKFNKRSLFFPLVVIALLGGYLLFLQSSATPDGLSNQVVSQAEAPVVEQLVVPEDALPTVASGMMEVPHPTDCAHCEPAVVTKTSEPRLSTNPSVDYIFKDFAARSDKTTPLSTFDFRKGAKVGQHVTFQVVGQEYSGAITVADESHPVAQTHVVALDGELGHLIVTTDAGSALSAQLQFFGDSRVLQASNHVVEGSAPSLQVQEITIADLYCAKPGTIYTATGLRLPGGSSGMLNVGAEEYLEIGEPVSAPSLESVPDSEFVLYLDFDGEDVVGTPWLGGALIQARPHARASDDAWITLVWERVVEAMAPFDINVTTDRAVYDTTDADKRMICVITPTDDAFPGAGGVAFLNSFRTNSPVIWAFNASEYSCSVTISHEAGHAFGLRHDGNATLEYYGGHNTDYTPGWAPIMGAGFSDGFNDEVNQWSKGEYTNASNTEDDLAIIADTAGLGSNGFGYKADDHGDFIGARSSVLTITGDSIASGEGLISREGDVDVFRFAASEGDIRMIVSSIDVQSTYPERGSETSGANLAVHVRLLDAAGEVIYEGLEHGTNGLSSIIETFVTAGTYYLAVDGIGKGADASVGFSDYASLGQYTISGELNVPPLSVLGGPKSDQTVLAGDTVIEVFNGTDFGFTTPSVNVTQTYILENRGSAFVNITNLSVSLVSGADFNITMAPSSSIAAGGAQFMDIEYAPSGQGAHTDTVRITYDTDQSEVFEFAIGGTATISSTSDNYENNDSSLTAYNLNPVEDVWLSDHLGVAFFLSDKKDWYTFTADAADGVVTVNTAYDPNAGNVQFELRNFNGDVLATSTAEQGNLQFLIPDNYTGSKLKFYIYVTTTDDNTVRNPYDLKWSSIPLVVGSDDFYEENDSLDQAYDLTGAGGTRLSEILGLGISNDEDWYKIVVPADPFTRMLYVAAEFDNSEGNIDIEVYDTNSNRFFSATTDNREVVTHHETVTVEDFADNFTPTGNLAIMGVEPGTYYIRVYGDFAGNSYDLTVEPRRDDSYEVVDPDGTENDTQADAFPLGESIVGKWLSEIDGVGTSADYSDTATAQNFVNRVDDDWYSFSIDASEIVEQITLEFLSFDGGSMEFFIVNAAGTVLASTSDFVFGIGVLTLDNPVGNSFFIHVVAESNISALSGYDFRVDFSSEPPFVEDPVEDNYEENDTFQELFNIRANEGRWLSSIDGYGSHLDADWFEINVPGNASKLVATLYHVTADGNMDLTLSKKDGPVHFVANGGGNTETITWNDPIPGGYALTVTGERRGNFYNLFWDITFEEDNYEENDTQATAFDLTGFERRSLSKLDGTGIQKDNDWYRITARADTVELRASVSFTHADGDIDLALYNSAGSLIRRSISSTDDESILYVNPAAGDYFVRVYFGNEGNEYDLTWSALSQTELDDIAAGDDAYEENDLIGQPYVLDATQLRLSSLLGNGIQKDDDWFEIELPEGNVGLLVECLFSDVEGDIDFEVYDPIGFPLAVRDSITDNERLFLDSAVPAGTYQIRVYGPGLGNEYDLYWRAFIDDVYEENDAMAEAYDISLLTGAPLSDLGIPTQSDDDWYLFEVAASGNPSIRVTLDYLHINGSIDFTIHNSAGDVIATADSLDDSQALFIPVSNGTYFVRVYGDDLYNPYDLTVEIFGDDAYEENDSSGAAADITSESGSVLPLVQFDDDWFKFSVTASNTFLNVFANFAHANGNIDLAVYKSGDLINPVAVSDSPDADGEAVTLSGDIGDYYIRVYGDNINPAYQLTWTVAPDDVYEENDIIGAAADITTTEGDVLNAIQFDQDWFEVEVAAGSITLSVDIEFLHEDGNLDLAIYDAAGVAVATVDTATDNESLVLGIFPFGATPETYFIKVSGQGAGTEYTLTWLTSTEDGFEGDGGNNTYFTATDALLDSEGVRISDSVGYGGSLNEDWYQVRINSGDDGIVIEARFIHDLGNDIDLELFNGDQSSLKRSIGVGDVERIHYKGPAGTYYLRVFRDVGGNAYDLYWNSYKEDNLELGVEDDPQIDNNTPDNDDPTTPRRLLQTNLNGNFYPGGTRPDLEFYLLPNLTQLDEDWYSVEVNAGEDIFIVDLEFEHISGDIDVAVYNRATSELVEKAETSTDNERITVRDLDPGDYLICVYGYGIIDPKEDLGWTFDPFTEDYSTIVENAAPGGFDYYDLAEGNARGLGNTYSLRWISAVEDQYDIETINVGDLEVNDTFDLSAEPPLVDQFGVSDSDNIIDDDVRTITLANTDGVPQDIDYRPTFTYSLAQFDEDWFKFIVDTGGTHDFFASITFNNNQGNLDLYVYDASGDLITASDGTITGVEFVEINDTGIKTYYVRVVGNDLGTSYELKVRGFLDDLYEENDTIAEADITSNITDLEGVSLNDVFIQRDVDIFRVDIPDDQVHLSVAISSEIPLTVDVLNAEGNILPGGFETSGGTSNIRNVSEGVISPEGGTYYFRVTGGNAGFSYGLLWTSDNVDEYEMGSNDSAASATNLTRFRLQPVYDPQNGVYLDPIQEFGFDYGLLGGLTLGTPAFDPFGHAIQEGDDWYAIQIPSWVLASATRGGQAISVLKRQYYARLTAEIEFTHLDGDINMEIYDDTDLGTPLGRSETANDIETLGVRIDPTDESRYYLIRVYGDDAENDYSLKWDFTTDDAYEQLEDDVVENDTNNFNELAYDLTNADGVSTEGIWLHHIEYLQDVNGDGVLNDGGFTSKAGVGIQVTDDWYAVVVSDGASQISVDCRFYSDNDTGYIYEPDALDIDFEVYFLAGNDGDPGTTDLRRPVLVGRSSGDTDDSLFTSDGNAATELTADVTTEIQEAAIFDVTEPGIYFIRIYYDNRTHPYTFIWDDIGDVDNTGDAAIIDDYLNGDWTFVLPENLPSALLLAPNANADGDNFPNWAEYALGLDASLADYAIIGQSIGEIDGKNYYQFEFLRRKEAVAAGYTFRVQETDNLIFDGSEAVYVDTLSVDDDFERVIYRCSESLDVQDKCFFRLQVEEPPVK